MTHDRLRTVWTRKIRPLIEEYLFDREDQLEEFEPTSFWPSLNEPS